MHLEVVLSRGNRRRCLRDFRREEMVSPKGHSRIRGGLRLFDIVHIHHTVHGHWPQWHDGVLDRRALVQTRPRVPWDRLRHGGDFLCPTRYLHGRKQQWHGLSLLIKAVRSKASVNVSTDPLVRVESTTDEPRLRPSIHRSICGRFGGLLGVPAVVRRGSVPGRIRPICGDVWSVCPRR